MDDFDTLARNELRKKRQFSRKWIIFTAYKKSLSEWVLEDTNNIGLYNISFYQAAYQVVLGNYLFLLTTKIIEKLR